MFIYFWRERESECVCMHMSWGGAERDGDTELEVGSGL